ncbi:MAG: DUF5009 domain-containing protein [Ignavibacteriales bacterium]|nr:DUF5009 domain-containing protein [Ignavibacteriales bacterium]
MEEKSTTGIRSYALDALRGFAILTMILSGSISFGNLPAWMHHAQVPPPLHKFIPPFPELPGSIWFSLFSICNGSCISTCPFKKNKR